MEAVNRQQVVETLQQVLSRVAPHARVILYGSEARGEARAESDIDLLILLDAPHVSPQEEDKILAPLYDVEVMSGIIISPIVMSHKRWEEAKRQTMFYHNVMKEGIVLQ